MNQAQFFLNELQRMNPATYLSIIHQVEMLFPKEEEEPLVWCDTESVGDNGTGIDADNAYAYWDDD